MATSLRTNKQLLLISEDGRTWLLVGDVTTGAEMLEIKRGVPDGVHMLTADRDQLETKGHNTDGENERTSGAVHSPD